MSGIQFSGLASGMDTSGIVEELMTVERTKVESVEKDKQRAEWMKEAYTEVNKEVYDFYKDSLFDMKLGSTYMKTKSTSSNENLIQVNNSPNAVKGTHTIEVKSLAKSSFLTGNGMVDGTTSSTTMGDLRTEAPSSNVISLGVGGETGSKYDIAISDSDTVQDVINNIKKTISENNLDVNVSYDSEYNRIFMSTKDTGEGKQIALSGDSAYLDALGFTSEKRLGSEGKDATFVYNGEELTSETNQVSVNGLSLELTGEAEGTSVNVTVATDVDGIYDKVKDFITGYNELVTSLNERIYADRARDYNPLTADEKEAMSEDEVELWETKIKDSLLVSNDTLKSIVSGMRTTLTGRAGADVDSIFSSLSEIGISTGDYSEKGLMHIYGDEDDDEYSGRNNDLMDAIKKNPEDVMNLFVDIADEMYSDLSDKMKRTTLSSALNIFNDKKVDSEIDDYENDISDLEDRLTTIEERYYKQFTAMELAIQEANSSMDWLMSSLGQ